MRVSIMKKLTQIALIVAALAIFATGVQAKSAQVSVAGGGGSTGDVVIISG
jgi:hypothetical protein